MKKLLILLLPILIFSGCFTKQEPEKPYVIMLSMDGFRWDYTDKVPTPNFDKIAKMGVKAKSLRPSFPTKTFPNHYSIATGLVPDHHGIVLNSFYDPETKRKYEIFDRTAVEDGSFYDGEPIWVTADNQGVVSGSFFWVGSEADIAGKHPTYWKRYDHKFDYGQRIDTVIAWLQKPEAVRPHLILWYYDEPDHSGHKFGPDSPELERTIVMMDSLLGVFLTKLESLPNAGQFNVIVTSDHGMGNISNDRKIALYDHVKKEWIEEIEGYNPNYNIMANKGYEDSIYMALQSVVGISVWKTGELPDRLIYGSNPRTLDLVVLADSSYSVVLYPDKKVGNGAHGFDNDNKDMHAIFYAFGPAFKVDYISPAFNNIDIYPLICEILNLNPAPVDGTLENVLPLLNK
ncbi:MAG: ectonucleotide pyrophosphatase/phosphodiesterase [Bacteroidales bacterium]|nr:ectonucleotide pyrophosphatase/phosphodiesterase [Bacteroidales bacterium]MCF8404745.1 ectonucleotide pyrophosphatase/phosphodiesterase [Bacteroidales bacterium]